MAGRQGRQGRQGVVLGQGKTSGGGAGRSRQATKMTQGNITRGTASGVNPGQVMRTKGNRSGDAADVPGSTPGKVL